AIGKVRQELNGAMDVMRDNMREMADRDAQLQDLQGKSSTLQSASGAFSKQATRLRKQQQWQRCKFWLLVAGLFALAVWALAIYFVEDKAMFAGISVALLAVLLPLGWFALRSWQGVALSAMSATDELELSSMVLPLPRTRPEVLPTAALSALSEDTTDTEVLPTAALSALSEDTTGAEVLPTAALSALSEDKTGTEVLPTAAQSALSEDTTGPEVLPTAAQSALSEDFRKVSKSGSVWAEQSSLHSGPGGGAERTVGGLQSSSGTAVGAERDSSAADDAEGGAAIGAERDGSAVPPRRALKSWQDGGAERTVCHGRAGKGPGRTAALSALSATDGLPQGRGNGGAERTVCHGQASKAEETAALNALRSLEFTASGGRQHHAADPAEVLHTALRAPRDAVICDEGKNVVPEVWKVLDDMKAFSDKAVTSYGHGIVACPCA
ncbi:unnamed protein product, partial [Polarella glacialis]